MRSETRAIALTQELLAVGRRGGPFGTIVIDSPWPSGSSTKRESWISDRTRPRYATLKRGELLALPVGDIAARDAMLVLWATWMHLPLAIECIEAWGFRYATGIPWLKVCNHPDYNSVVMGGGKFAPFPPPPIKPIYGPGVWFQHCTELILIARRGRPFGAKGNPRPARKGIIIHPRGEHSEKPGELQDWIDGAGFPEPKLEMFARRPRQGWKVWGNEVQ